MGFTGRELVDRALFYLDDDGSVFTRNQILNEINSKLRDVLNRYPADEFNYPLKEATDTMLASGKIALTAASVDDYLKENSLVFNGERAAYLSNKEFEKRKNYPTIMRPSALDPIWTVANGYLKIFPAAEEDFTLSYIPLIELEDTNVEPSPTECDDELLEFALWGAIGYLAGINDYAPSTAAKFTELFHTKVNPLIPKREPRHERQRDN